METLNQALLYLFSSVYKNDSKNKANEKDFVKAMKNGIIFTKEAAKCVTSETVKNAISEYGVKIKAFNKGAFYKSFETAETTPTEIKILQQLTHYLGTYGAEQLGMNPVIIVPDDIIKMPKHDEPANFRVINAISLKQIKEKIDTLLESGVALDERAIQSVIEIIDSCKFTFSSQKIDDIKNKEVQVRLYEKLQIMPENPVNFMRYVTYTATQRTLLVKDKRTIEALENNPLVAEMTLKYAKTAAKERKLAQIFNRYKPLFMAIKQSASSGCSRTVSTKIIRKINRISKLSKTEHIPKTTKALDAINSQDFSLDQIKEELKNVTIYKKISVLNSLRNSLTVPKAKLFHIRNGKGFVKPVEAKNYNNEKLEQLHKFVLKDIADQLKTKLSGKSVYIPEGVIYTLPTSQKKMVQGIPFGSRLKVKGDAIVGIHWYDTTSRVDLDLHITDEKNNRIGWNTYADTSLQGEIIFSGDMTAAPKPYGATEAMLFKTKAHPGLYAVTVNRFRADTAVPYKVYIGQADSEKFKLEAKKGYREEKNRKYLLSAHETALSFNLNIDTGDEQIGYVNVNKDGSKEFCFFKDDFGKHIVAKNNDISAYCLKAIKSQLATMITFNELIPLCGAKLTQNKEKADISLEPNNITQDTFVKLLKQD